MHALARIAIIAAAGTAFTAVAAVGPAIATLGPTTSNRAALAIAPAATPAATITPAAATCSAVLFFGARGSGAYGPGSANWPAGRPANDYYGLGSTVSAVRDRLIAKLGPARTVSTASLRYPASRVITLTHAPAQYFAGMAAGTTSAIRYLVSRAAVCPNQQIVLAGHSQGAMVMHRVLHALSAYPAILRRVAAVVLVADGDGVPNDFQTRYGNASRTTSGIGQSLRLVSGASAAKFTRGQKRIVLSVCTYTDVVCDFSQTFGISPTLPASPTWLLQLFARYPLRVKRGLSVHTHYAGTSALNTATDRAAYLVRTTPWPTPQRTFVDATVGTPLRYQLTADLAHGYTAQWAYASGTRLPLGLTLSTSGEITGTPAAPGDATIPVRVRSLILGVGSIWIPAWVTIHTTAPVPSSGLQLVSTAADGTPANADSIQQALSPDGTKVAFTSTATNLVPGVNKPALYIKDLITGAVTVGSSAADGTPASGGGSNPAFSADSQHLVFTSRSPGLTPNAKLDVVQVFVKNLVTGEVQLASSNAIGEEGNFGAGYAPGNPSVSGDGSLVAFISSSTNFGDTVVSPHNRAFLKNLSTGTVVQLDATQPGFGSSNTCTSASVAEDGTLAAFSCDADVLANGTHTLNVYVYDVASHAVILATIAPDGTAGGGVEQAFTGDGRSLVFTAYYHYVAGDNASQTVVDIRDLTAGTVRSVSVTAAGGEVPNYSYGASPNYDGSLVAFMDWVEPISGTTEVYLKNMSTGELTHVSEGNGTSGGGRPSLDSAGDKLTFTSSRLLTSGYNGTYQQVYLYTH